MKCTLGSKGILEQYTQKLAEVSKTTALKGDNRKAYIEDLGKVIGAIAPDVTVDDAMKELGVVKATTITKTKKPGGNPQLRENSTANTAPGASEDDNKQKRDNAVKPSADSSIKNSTQYELDDQDVAKEIDELLYILNLPYSSIEGKNPVKVLADLRRQAKAKIDEVEAPIGIQGVLDANPDKYTNKKEVRERGDGSKFTDSELLTLSTYNSLVEFRRNELKQILSARIEIRKTNSTKRKQEVQDKIDKLENEIAGYDAEIEGHGTDIKSIKASITELKQIKKEIPNAIDSKSSKILAKAEVLNMRAAKLADKAAKELADYKDRLDSIDKSWLPKFNTSVSNAKDVVEGKEKYEAKQEQVDRAKKQLEKLNDQMNTLRNTISDIHARKLLIVGHLVKVLESFINNTERYIAVAKKSDEHKKLAAGVHAEISAAQQLAQDKIQELYDLKSELHKIYDAKNAATQELLGVQKDAKGTEFMQNSLLYGGQLTNNTYRAKNKKFAKKMKKFREDTYKGVDPKDDKAMHEANKIMQEESNRLRGLAEYNAEKTVPQSLATGLKVSHPTSRLAEAKIAPELYSEMVDNSILHTANNDKQAALIEVTGVYNNNTEYDGDAPHVLLLRQNGGGINKNVAVAVELGMLKYIARNVAPLTQLSPKNIESMYGIKEEDYVTATTSMLEGGIPLSLVASSVGNYTTAMLGIKGKVEFDEEGNEVADYTELAEKVAIGLGLSTVLYAVKTGVLELREVNDEFGNITQTVKLASQYRDVQGNPKANSKFKDQMSASLEYADKTLGVDSSKTIVNTVPTGRTAEEVTKRNDKYTKPAPMVAESIAADEAVRWSPASDAMQFFSKLAPEVRLALQGYVEDVDKKLEGELTRTAEQKLSQTSKNKQIYQDTETLLEVNEMRKNGELDGGMYFKWFVSKNLRQMLDAEGGFGPQSIKLHRYAAHTEDSEGTVSNDDPLSVLMFKLGVAQSMGFDIDKNPFEDSVAYADKLLTTENLDEIENILRTGVTVDHKVKATLKSGVEIEIKELTHGINGLLEGRKYVEYGVDTGFDTVMTVEFDGLTNGFGHKMLQFLSTTDVAAGVTQDVIKWLHKAGIQLGTLDSVNDIAADIKSKKLIDAYLTLGDSLTKPGMSLIDMIEETWPSQYGYDKNVGKNVLKEKFANKRMDMLGTDIEAEMKVIMGKFLGFMPSLVDMEVEGHPLSMFVRDLMKDPFMTFGYSAGFKSMSNSVASMLINETMQRLMNADPKDADAIAIAESLGFSGLAALQVDLANKRYMDITNSEGKTLVDVFRKRIKATYGEAIEIAVTENFKGLTEINQTLLQTSTTMYAIFKVLYEREVAKIAPDGAVTNRQRDAIVEKLWKVFPIVKAPDSTTFENGIALFNTETVRASDNAFGSIQAKDYSDPDNKVYYASATRRTFKSPGAAIAALMTQSQDSSGTAHLIAKHGEKTQQMFDGHVLGVNQHNVIRILNDDFMKLGLSTEWSQVTAAKEGLDRVVAGSKELVSEADYKVFMDDVFKVLVEEKMKTMPKHVNHDYVRDKLVSNVGTAVTTMDSIAEKVGGTREEFRGLNLVMEQFVASKEFAAVHTGLNDRIAKNSNVSSDRVAEVIAEIQHDADILAAETKCD